MVKRLVWPGRHGWLVGAIIGMIAMWLPLFFWSVPNLVYLTLGAAAGTIFCLFKYTE
jgi:hypothetical protein